MSERGWWYRASNDERLAQIDGCIEVGLNGPQCAMNCGASAGAITVFANRHGRYFGTYRTHSETRAAASRVSLARVGSVKRAKKAYLAGEPVDFWSVE